MSQNKKQLAVFDLDGTSVRGQSGQLFTMYLLSHGLMTLPRALKLGWWGLRYLLHLPYRQNESRELVLGAFREADARTVEKVMVSFHDEVLVKRYRSEAIAEVRRCHEDGMTCVLVSATFSAIAERASEVLGCDAVLATHMEVGEDGRYTGRVEGTVLAGSEKYRALRTWADGSLGEGAWEIARAYGDHHSDIDVLSHAREAYAVCPGTALRSAARRNGWTILEWES